MLAATMGMEAEQNQAPVVLPTVLPTAHRLAQLRWRPIHSTASIASSCCI